MKKEQERQLVFYCARTHLDEEKIQAIRRLLDGSLDWNYIMENTSFFSISPLLFYNLKGIADGKTIPRPVIDTLMARYVYTMNRNTQIYSGLQEVLDRLRERNILVILLKGVALAKTVYSNIALRTIGDVDILIKETDLHSVEEILLEMGYNSYVPSGHEDLFQDHHHLPPYIKSVMGLDEPLQVEVHHNIAPEIRVTGIKSELLWEDAQTFNPAGPGILILSPENLILHLCIHLSVNCFEGGIRTLVDISESIRHYDNRLDWHSVLGKSKEFGVSRLVYYPLLLAKEIMDADVPSYVLRELKLHLQLKFPELDSLKLLFKRIALTGYSHSFLYQFSRLLYKSLCISFLSNSEMHIRIKYISSIWTKAFHNIPEKII